MLSHDLWVVSFGHQVDRHVLELILFYLVHLRGFGLSLP